MLSHFPQAGKQMQNFVVGANFDHAEVGQYPRRMSRNKILKDLMEQSYPIYLTPIYLNGLKVKL